MNKPKKKQSGDMPPGAPFSSKKYDRHNLPYMKPIPWERRTPRRKEPKP